MNLFMANNGQSLELKFALYTLVATIVVAVWAFICNFLNTVFAITNPIGQVIVAILIGFVVLKALMFVRGKVRQKNPDSN